MEDTCNFIILYLQSRNVQNWGWCGYKNFKVLIGYILAIKDVDTLRTIFENMWESTADVSFVYYYVFFFSKVLYEKTSFPLLTIQRWGKIYCHESFLPLQKHYFVPTTPLHRPSNVSFLRIIWHF